MPTPLPLPMRVLVKGASTVNWVSWMGGPRTDLAFSRAMEAKLLSDGRPCTVQTITMPREKTSAIIKSWQQEVLGYSPDVVVLVYGHYETIHLFLPHWMEKHANSLAGRPRAVRSFYRKRILGPAWISLARFQAAMDKVVKPTIRRGRPRKVVADLERYITQVQKVGSPMVFLFELLPPSGKFISWFPGMPVRLKVMNAAIEDLVNRLDKPNVRYFRVSELVDKYCDGDLEVATPDGFHYTPELHGHIGTALAEQVEEWADTQPHLAL